MIYPAPDKYPTAAAVASYLNAHERKYNKPLEKAWISFDARDELVRAAIDDKRFINTIKGPHGELGLEWMGTLLYPFNQIDGATICLAVDAK